MEEPIACQLLPSAGTGICIDLSNPGKMCKSFQRYYSLQEKLEDHAVVLARIQPALASKRQMERAPSSSSLKRLSVPPRPLALHGVGRWLELGGGTIMIHAKKHLFHN